MKKHGFRLSSDTPVSNVEAPSAGALITPAAVKRRRRPTATLLSTLPLSLATSARSFIQWQLANWHMYIPGVRLAMRFMPIDSTTSYKSSWSTAGL